MDTCAMISTKSVSLAEDVRSFHILFVGGFFHAIFRALWMHVLDKIIVGKTYESGHYEQTNQHAVVRQAVKAYQERPPP